MHTSSGAFSETSGGSAQSQQVHFGHYAVCFFDLLSQRALMESLRQLPTTPAETNAFIDAARKTAGTVIGFRSMLTDYVRSFSQLDPLLRAPHEATPAEVATFERHRQSLLKTQYFADTCLLYFAFPEEVSVGLKSLYGLLVGVGLTQLALLSARVAARGSIEVDIGTDVLPNEVYGPVLARAYQLEAEVAQYPRIIVGEGFGEFLRHLRSRNGSTATDRYSRLMADGLAGLVTRDSDERQILHYLGPAFRALAGQMPWPFVEVAAKAHSFVSAFLAERRAAHDVKLTERYERLDSYFRENINRWTEADHD